MNAQANRATERDAPFEIGNGQEVIFLDDSDSDLFLARICYERSGATNALLTLSSPTALIELMLARESNGEPPPALLFLDINMPEMSGFEVLKWIKQREHFRAIPIVFMFTNSINPADRETSERLGAEDYFVKPSSHREFTALLRSIHV